MSKLNFSLLETLADRKRETEHLYEFFKIMNPIKLDVLRGIIVSKPGSVYQLAKHIDMDVGNVQRYVRELESLGLIRTERSLLNGRVVIKPIPICKKIQIDLCSALKR